MIFYCTQRMMEFNFLLLIYIGNDLEFFWSPYISNKILFGCFFLCVCYCLLQRIFIKYFEKYEWKCGSNLKLSQLLENFIFPNFHGEYDSCNFFFFIYQLKKIFFDVALTQLSFTLHHSRKRIFFLF